MSPDRGAGAGGHPGAMDAEPGAPERIDAMLPRGDGHQFVFYGDACSGVAGAGNESAFIRTNDVVRRLTPAPQFVVFAGDEIVGLTTSEAELRDQWRHWFDVEMAWLDRSATPLYNTTSNHTTYDEMSERVFADVLDHLPRNGPIGQEGLSYYVRRGDLLLVFLHTSWTGLGGEGHIETDWLATVLDEHADARFTFVVGHHPAFPVNGFSGEHQREINRAQAEDLWEILVAHEVIAYLCSHILAFDVQVHRGVLQVVSAGAATPHQMPADIEYLHIVQAAVDELGLRYQAIDQDGRVREQLSWPPNIRPSTEWEPHSGQMPIVSLGSDPTHGGGGLVAWRIRGTTAVDGAGPRQTLVAAVPQGTALPSAWIGLTGLDQRLTVMLGPSPGRSPHYWFGPSLGAGETFDLQLALHFGMGPGGVLWRSGDRAPWSSLTSSSPWGPERLTWPFPWSIGCVGDTPSNADFRGRGLDVAHTVVQGVAPVESVTGDASEGTRRASWTSPSGERPA